MLDTLSACRSANVLSSHAFFFFLTQRTFIDALFIVQKLICMPVARK